MNHKWTVAIYKPWYSKTLLDPTPHDLNDARGNKFLQPWLKHPVKLFSENWKRLRWSFLSMRTVFKWSLKIYLDFNLTVAVLFDSRQVRTTCLFPCEVLNGLYSAAICWLTKTSSINSSTLLWRQNPYDPIIFVYVQTKNTAIHGDWMTPVAYWVK